MTKNYRPRTCEKCNIRYKPTGAVQRFCESCGIINRRERSLNWYHENNGRAYSREYKRARRNSAILIEDHVSEEDFRVMIVDSIVNRRGNMLATKSTMRKILRRLGIYEDSWLQKRNRGGLALSFYDILLDEFKKHGGVYFGNTSRAGNHYQFPVLKERKT